jgi:sigma-B regulation protein RsbU (phosphoserine phosphatase)
MGEAEKEQILKVLSGAIQRETGAFNFYGRKSEDTTLPRGVRGLLSRLAEEERRHRRLLLGEYMAVKKGWREREDREKGKTLSFSIPEKLTLTPLEVSSDLETAAVSLPSRLVGGDNVLSFVLRGPDGEKTITVLLLYDVMGHSLETTEINGLAARIVGEYSEMSGSGRVEAEQMSPKRLVDLLNRNIYEVYGGQGMFLTMICVLFDLGKGSFTYTCAGHEPPFVILEGSKAASLLNTQLLVGIDPEYPYREHEVPFGGGDLFCIFSDGVIEAKNEEGEYFGREGVKRILEEAAERSPREIIESVLDGVGEFLGGEPLEDEVTIIVVKSKGA